MDRFKRLLALTCVAGLILAAGCSDDSGDNTKQDAGADQAVTLDSSQHETAPPDKGPDPDTSTDGGTGPGNMAEGCTKNTDCTGGAKICLNISKAKGASICSRYCTVDDSTTPLVNEDDCPTGFRCGKIALNDKTTKNFCLKDCTPSFTKNPCPKSSKVSCLPSSTRYAMPKQAVCFYSACQSGKDCPVFSDKTCAYDSDCKAVGTGAFCSDKYCALPGSCTAGGICGPHKGVGKATAKVGDPCKSDLDCPENGRCVQESNAYTNSIGVAFANGYCVVRGCMFGTTLTSFACPSGSSCNNLYYGGYCFKTCRVDKTDIKDGCRNNPKDKGGDYDCYDWTNWTVRGVKVSTEPLCQNASTQTCDSLGKSECSSLGDAKNSSKMRCRDRHSGKDKSNKKDPKGVCLDDTKSGPFVTSAPDAGTTTPDAGTTTPDAGVSGG